MDWFLYDNGPRHERVKREICQRSIKVYMQNLEYLQNLLSKLFCLNTLVVWIPSFEFLYKHETRRYLPLHLILKDKDNNRDSNKTNNKNS